MIARQWWKVLYDVKNSTWHAFGRVAFIRAESLADAMTRTHRYVAVQHPGFEMVFCQVEPSSFQARLKFWALVLLNRAWKRNVIAGVPNTKETTRMLWRKRDV